MFHPYRCKRVFEKEIVRDFPCAEASLKNFQVAYELIRGMPTTGGKTNHELAAAFLGVKPMAIIEPSHHAAFSDISFQVRIKRAGFGIATDTYGDSCVYNKNAILQLCKQWFGSSADLRTVDFLVPNHNELLYPHMVAQLLGYPVETHHLHHPIEPAYRIQVFTGIGKDVQFGFYVPLTSTGRDAGEIVSAWLRLSLFIEDILDRSAIGYTHCFEAQAYRFLHDFSDFGNDTGSLLMLFKCLQDQFISSGVLPSDSSGPVPREFLDRLRLVEEEQELPLVRYSGIRTPGKPGEWTIEKE